MAQRIGLIADTHGWLDPRVLEEFAEVDAILHAGDIGALVISDRVRQRAAEVLRLPRQ